MNLSRMSNREIEALTDDELNTLIEERIMYYDYDIEREIKRSGLIGDYVWELYAVVNVWGVAKMGQAERWWNVLHATSRQRCIAALRMMRDREAVNEHR